MVREHLAASEGAALGDLVQHWHDSRTTPRTEIAPQFELNLFVRQWHAANPGGPHHEALSAWRAHRGTPVDARQEEERSPWTAPTRYW